MSKFNVPEILESVFWVGVKDWNRRVFDALIPLPKGTTYNAYLVKGKTKTVLIDTVNPGFKGELEAKIRQVTNPAEVDYIIMNHAEPDHAGGIPHMMNLSGKAKLVTTSKGAEAAQIYYGVPEGRIEVVADSSTLDLGGKTQVH